MTREETLRAALERIAFGPEHLEHEGKLIRRKHYAELVLAEVDRMPPDEPGVVVAGNELLERWLVHVQDAGLSDQAVYDFETAIGVARGVSRGSLRRADEVTPLPALWWCE